MKAACMSKQAKILMAMCGAFYSLFSMTVLILYFVMISQ